MIAGQLTQLEILFVSSKNPYDQNASLLEQLEARRFLYAPELEAAVRGVQAILPQLKAHPVAPFDQWLDISKPFPYRKSFEETRSDPVLCLHSSGSTGKPKPIVIPNSYFAAADYPLRQIPGRQSRNNMTMLDFPGGGSFLSPFPPFHLGGVFAMIGFPCFAFEATIVLLLPDRAPTPQLLFEVIQAKKPRGLFCPPSLIEAVSALPGGLDLLCGCDSVVYAGGPLSSACGDALSRRTKLGITYGSTETGGLHLLASPPETWDYMEFHPDLNARFEPALEGTYELIFTQDDPHAYLRGVTHTFPHQKIWRTRDTFIPHPTKAGLWKFHGRNDDIIVFSNGAKYNPIPAENELLASEQISGCLIAGDSRTQTCALIEPKAVDADSKALVAAIWPLVEKANAKSQRQGQLHRRMIAVVEPEGLVRAPKGTVVRSLTREKYRDTIDQLYRANDDLSVSNGSGPTFAAPSSLRSALITFVGQCARSVPQLAQIRDADDLYVHGLDSIQTAELSRTLRSGLHSQYGELPWLTAHFIFANPSIEKLAGVIENAVSQNISPVALSNGAGSQMPEDQMLALIEKYTAALPPRRHEKTVKLAEGQTVLLTGSTGTLGLRILQSLHASPAVTSIVCLDRDVNAGARVGAALPSLPLSSGRINFHQAHLGEAQLGLSSATYESLLDSVDLVIHNAWKVDFNHSLPSFEPVHIAGTANLIAFAAASSRQARLAFISSISTVSKWSSDASKSGVPVAEVVPKNPAVVARMGYAQSKYVAERLLDAAAARYDGELSFSILRVGQIAGPVCDREGPGWNAHEWFPALLRTSKALGCLPDHIPDLDWIPVDLLGAAIVEVLLGDATGGAEARGFNMINPRRTAWKDVVHSVQEQLPGVTIVPLAAWLAKLGDMDAGDARVMETYPVLKILPFFKAMQAQTTDLEYVTEHGQRASQTFRNLLPVKGEWMRGWIQQLAL